MFDSVRTRRKNKAQAEIRMAPLIDMVFILLIFFLVTTSFVAETGITVEKPQARSSESLDKESLMVGIGPTGQVYVEGRRVSMFSLRSLVRNKVNRTTMQWINRISGLVLGGFGVAALLSTAG